MTKKLLERIAGREAAQAFLPDLVAGQSDDYVVGLARELRKFSDEILGRRNDDPIVMTDAEAEAFERRVEQYGTYAGQRYGDIPISNLQFRIDKADQFRRYIGSDRAQRREDSGG